MKYNWKRYAHPLRDFWDAYDEIAPHNTLVLSIVGINGKWCAIASTPSRYGKEGVSHAKCTDFEFSSREAAMRAAEGMASDVISAWEREQP